VNPVVTGWTTMLAAAVHALVVGQFCVVDETPK
jgi:hypothetical protein